jgi:hypothetical protein
MNGDLPHLSCQELVDLVTEYFENALAAEQRAHLEQHLVLCQGCRTYVRQYEVLLEALALLASVEAENLSEELPPNAFAEYRKRRTDL